MAPSISRRRLLQAGVLAGTAALSGCLGDGERSTPTGSAGSDDVQELSIDGSDLVVRLREDHAVTRLNLIGPDGERYAGTDVATGETQATIQLLDIQPGVGGYEHYEPGTHELATVTDEGSDSLDVDLVPDLRIVDVQQYRDGSRPSDLGKLAVTVENRGTGPTWVYDVTYQGAPNEQANIDLVSDPGVPQLEKPDTSGDFVVGSDAKQTFVSSTSPIVFREGAEQSCSGEITLNVILGLPEGSPLEADVSASLNGEIQPIGLDDEFTCNRISVELDDEN